MIRTLFAALLLALSLPAAGQPYLFAGAGSSEVNDQRNSTAALAIGYRFNRHVSAEISSSDLGLGAAAVWHPPIGNSASILAKAGMQHLGRKWAGDGSRSSLNTEDLGTKATLGLGASYAISKQFGIRGMVERVGGGHSLVTIGAVLTF